MKEQLLRSLPKVDVICNTPEIVKLRNQYGDKILLESVRRVLADLREGILSDMVTQLPNCEDLCARIEKQVHQHTTLSLRPVINGTGILLHTNLGRACLSEKAALSAMAVATRYSTLEYDLAAGQRGSRYVHVEELLCKLTGAESAMVVNNNAAAVLLILSALAKGGEVPVSRGELVEIGGSFRVPEIMEACGAQLKEIGATNKTHFSDYERAIGPNTKALMKVHTSNYRIVGAS
jgi:L-seryl-tRNA(Ser) seleniumtransferase